jgi:PHD/YefM family antitoxin component YafN of YafNO toxin-antitoxin module
MKTFVQLRELAGRKPHGDMVFNKRIDRVPVMIHKEKNKFVVYIDGDRLDAYSTQREAEKMAKEFVKQYKG